MNNEKFRFSPYSTPLFRNCFKAYPSNYPNSTAYLAIKNQFSTVQQIYQNMKQSYVCPVLTDQNNNDFNFIALQGQCLYKYVLSKKNDLENRIFSQDQVWVLIACLCQAFVQLKLNNFQHKLTHLRQYCIRKIGIVYRFKLIFHETMVSQMDAGGEGLCKWDQLYLSPQELTGQFVPQKSIVFSFGMILLNICSNSDRGRLIYKKNSYQIDQKIIKSKINIANKKYGYSKVLCKFIYKCLLQNYQQRFNFLELKNYLVRLINKKNIKNYNLLSDIIQLNMDQNIKQQQADVDNCQKTEKKNRVQFNFCDMIKKGSLRYKSLSVKKSQNNKTRKKKKRSREKRQSLNFTINNRVQGKKNNKNNDEFNEKILRLSQGRFQKSKQKDNILKKIQQKTKDKQINFLPQIFKENSKQKDKTAQEKTIYRGGIFGKNIKQKEYNSETIKQMEKVRNNNQKYCQESKQQNNNQFEDQNLQDIQIRQEHSHEFQVQTKRCPVRTQSKIQQGKISIQLDTSMKRSEGHSKNYSHQIISSQNTRRKISSEIQQINLQKSKFFIPQLTQQIQSFTLESCMKPTQQLIRKIGKTGFWIQGDVYYGDLLNGKRNGLALQMYSNGQYYYGSFSNDLYHGNGFYYWNKNQYFFGQFINGQKKWGRLEGETKYQGQFYNNKRHGQGTCWYSTGQIYSGNWENGKRNGRGFVIQPSGSKFVGHWVRGNRRGKGYLQTQILTIAGIWNGEMIEKQSLIEYRNGDLFKGQTGPSLQKIHGQYISRSGIIFKGDFKNDQPKQGMLQYLNGDKYFGQLNKLKRHGYGQYYYSSGDFYKGFWKDNVKSFEMN